MVLKNVVASSLEYVTLWDMEIIFKAVLVSNAIREIKRFVDTVHPIKRDKMNRLPGGFVSNTYSQLKETELFGK